MDMMFRVVIHPLFVFPSLSFGQFCIKSNLPSIRVHIAQSVICPVSTGLTTGTTGGGAGPTDPTTEIPTDRYTDRTTDRTGFRTGFTDAGAEIPLFLTEIFPSCLSFRFWWSIDNNKLPQQTLHHHRRHREAQATSIHRKCMIIEGITSFPPCKPFLPLV